jgi:pyrroline-5-carboxylate reductase
MNSTKIASVGAGQMASALIRGWVASGLCEASEIVVSDPNADACRRLQEWVPGVRVEATNARAVQSAPVVLLATKPQQIATVATEIRGVLVADPLIISVAAGVTLSSLSQWLGTSRVVRVMPNTPCLVGMGASAFSLGAGANEADADAVTRLLSAVGWAVRLEEKHLDAVTGVSGSGPAYIYVLIEALSDGGVRMGLPRDVANALAVHTVRGAAEMVIREEVHPAVLKDRVASPGGTTIAGLQALEEHGFRAAVMAAVVAATRRSDELRAGSAPPSASRPS